MADNDYPKLRNVEFVPMSVGGKEGLVLRDPLLYTDRVLFVPREVVAVMQFFDGTKTFREIQAEVEKHSGATLDLEDIRKVAEELDKSYFLVSESFLKEKRRIEGDFFRAQIRPAVHMGAGYQTDPEKLKEEFSSYFAGVDGGAAVGTRSMVQAPTGTGFRRSLPPTSASPPGDLLRPRLLGAGARAEGGPLRGARRRPRRDRTALCRDEKGLHDAVRSCPDEP